MARVNATVDDRVLETWRACARVQGVSLSGLIADWMTELEPGMAEVVRLGEAFQRANAEHREKILRGVTAAYESVRPVLEEESSRFSETVSEMVDGDPRTCNTGVR